LLEATKKSCHAKRDYAIVAVLLDCGLRASECCNLKIGDIDLNARCVTVVGKGNKRRSVFFGRETAKAFWLHLRVENRDVDDWCFLSDRGVRTGEPLKPNGLLQLIQRLGKTANIRAVRCSPHTLRHTYAVSFLRAGGNVFTLRESLGHTNLQMTQKYVMVAEADLSGSQVFSPMDNLKRGRGL
jgi:site-specific recombinase XerD